MGKALVLYSSTTGNTEKVARVFTETLGQFPWQVDTVEVDKNWQQGPVTVDDYDLLCVGSSVHWSLPSPWLVQLLRSPEIFGGKVTPGPKCGVAFATYGGAHLGPREADVCLTFLEVLFEHLGFLAIGRLAIPGKFSKAINPLYYHQDLQNRPNQKDLGRVASFVKRLHERSEIVSLLDV